MPHEKVRGAKGRPAPRRATAGEAAGSGPPLTEIFPLPYHSGTVFFQDKPRDPPKSLTVTDRQLQEINNYQIQQIIGKIFILKIHFG